MIVIDVWLDLEVQIIDGMVLKYKAMGCLMCGMSMDVYMGWINCHS